MLLVKSKESKSSGSKTSTKSWGWIPFSPLIFSSFEANAQAPQITSASSIASIFLSLLLVVAIIFILAYAMRRFNVTPASHQQLKTVASLMAGTRERIIVLQVGNEQHLVGVTAQNINHLAKLEQPLPESAQSGEMFKDKLAQVLASKLNPNLNKALEKDHD